MGTTLRKLSLNFPKAIEATLLDALDDLDPPLSGYSFMEGSGRGASISLASAQERVRGAMRVVRVEIILPEEQIETVLAQIAQAVETPQIAFWVEPILDFGRLQ